VYNIPFNVFGYVFCLHVRNIRKGIAFATGRQCGEHNENSDRKVE